jgi:hypothetical protein
MLLDPDKRAAIERLAETFAHDPARQDQAAWLIGILDAADGDPDLEDGEWGTGEPAPWWLDEFAWRTIRPEDDEPDDPGRVPVYPQESEYSLHVQHRRPPSPTPEQAARIEREMRATEDWKASPHRARFMAEAGMPDNLPPAAERKASLERDVAALWAQTAGERPSNPPEGVHTADPPCAPVEEVRRRPDLDRPAPVEIDVNQAAEELPRSGDLGGQADE